MSFSYLIYKLRLVTWHAHDNYSKICRNEQVRQSSIQQAFNYDSFQNCINKTISVKKLLVKKTQKIIEVHQITIFFGAPIACC